MGRSDDEHIYIYNVYMFIYICTYIYNVVYIYNVYMYIYMYMMYIVYI